MSWSDILSIIEAEWSQFQKPGILEALRDWTQYASRESAIDALRFDESAHQRILDLGCLQFAKTRKWPQLNQEQKYWIYARLDAARTLVKLFLISERSKGWIVPNPATGIRDQKVLEYVLVYSWHHIGRGYFLDHAIFRPMGPFDPLGQLPEPEL